MHVDGQQSDLLDAQTSYHPPVITNFTGPAAIDADTAGGQIVHVGGQHFGPADTVINGAVYGPVDVGMVYTAHNCTLTVPHYEITCITMEGVGLDLNWAVTVANQRSERVATDYDVPQVVNLTGPGVVDAWPHGGQVVHVHGINFGPPGSLTYGRPSLQNVTYGPTGIEYTAQNCTVVSHLQIDCLTVPATGPRLSWTVTVADQTGSPSAATSSVAGPEIVSHSPLHPITNGGEIMTVMATNIPLLDKLSTVYVRIGDQLVTPIPQSPFNGSSALVAASNPAAQTAWSDASELQGEYTGLLADPVNSSWPCSDMNGRCMRLTVKVPEGFGADVPFNIEIERSQHWILSPDFPLAYAEPFIDRIRVETIKSDPNVLGLRIIGTNYGVNNITVSGRVVISDKTNPSAGTNNFDAVIMSWDHDEVFVVIPGSVKKGLVNVWVDGRESNEGSFQEISPMLSGRTGQALDSRCFDTRGGEIFEFTAEHLGGADNDNTRVNIGPKNYTLKSGPTLDTSANSDNETYLMELVIPPGQGQFNVFSVAVEGTLGSNIPSSLSYLKYCPPQVDSVQVVVPEDGEGDGGSGRRAQVVVPGVSGRVPTAGARIRIQGINLGLGDPASRRDSQVDVVFTSRNPALLDCPVWGHEMIECFVPEFEGRGHEVLVRVAGQYPLPSNRVLLEAQEPAITDIQPRLLSTAGGDILTITGRNFGVNGVAVNISGRPCEILQRPTQLAAAADGSVFASHTLAFDHHSIQCRTPPLDGKDNAVVASVWARWGTPGPAVPYETPLWETEVATDVHPPVVTSTDPKEAYTNGTALMSIYGRNFSVDGTVVLRALEAKGVDRDVPIPAGNIVSWDHNRIRVYVPEGLGVGREVVVTVNGQTNDQSATGLTYRPGADVQTAPISTKYMPPSLHAITPANGSPAGGFTVTIFGENFGPVRPRVFFQNGDFLRAECLSANQSQFSHQHTQCTAPAGFGNGTIIEVITGSSTNRQSSLRSDGSGAIGFVYNEPQVDFVMPNRYDLKLNASQRVQIGTSNPAGQMALRGINFGTWGIGGNVLPTTVDLGDMFNRSQRLKCLNPTRFSDGEIRCEPDIDVVGPKRIYLTVPGYSREFTTGVGGQPLVSLVCPVGWYGNVTEYCLLCPTGTHW